MLKGYSITESAPLYESKRSLLWRAMRESDRKQVVLKRLNLPFPLREDLVRFRREFETILKLRFDNALRAEALESSGHSQVLVLEDVGGQSLQEIISGAGCSVRDAVWCAIQIAESLEGLHQQDIIHKDVSPANIVWNRERNLVKIVDYGLATEISGQAALLDNPHVLEGTLLYMAPEQTGRMSRGIDHRADLYSLGATLYTLLVRRPPFDSNDAIEIVHGHLAQTPVPPHVVNPDLDETISDIVMKLLAKMPEHRYQSASGVLADLRTCLAALDAGRPIEPFQLGVFDAPKTLQIPQVLYGREAETRALLAAYGRVREGARMMLLVAGYSGIGKSALVHEVHAPICADRGLFIEGKFDQFKRDIAYGAVIDALRALVRQLLAEPGPEVARWSDRVKAALGANGQVVADLVPELDTLIGKSPPVPPLPPAEAKGRFQFCLQRFVQSIATSDNPLVMFLDDLQWADPATLGLLESLLCDPHTTHLLIIGAYRDNEVGPAHPFTAALDALRRAGGHYETVHVGPLGEADVNQLVADALRGTPAETAELAALCTQKTGGNPFFLAQFLRALDEAGYITRDESARRHTFDLDRIRAAGLTDNVVDLMANKIGQLPPSTQRALSVAACIGNRFDLRTLSLATKSTSSEMVVALWSALKAGLVIPLGEAYRLLDEDNDANGRFRFLHDRVQQAAYSALGEPERERIHHTIGNLLLSHLPAGEREERLFEIVNHLALGRRLLDEREVLSFASLALEAARKAKACAAFSTALNALTTASELFQSRDWVDHHALVFQVFLERTECAYLVGRDDEVDRLFNVILEHANPGLERGEIYLLRTAWRTHQDRYQDAIESALEGLRTLGIDISLDPAALEAAAGAELGRLFGHVANHGRDQILAIPPISDPTVIQTTSLLVKPTVAAYMTNQPLFALLVVKASNQFFEQGYFPQSPFALVFLSAMYCRMGRFAEAFELGENAIALTRKHNNSGMTCTVHFMQGIWSVPTVKHLRESAEYLRIAGRAGLETKEWFLDHSSFCLAFNEFHRQVPLDERVEATFGIPRGFGTRAATLLLVQARLNLQGKTDGLETFDSPGVSERELYEELAAANQGPLTAGYWGLKMQTLYLWGKPRAVLALRPEFAKVHPYTLGLTLWAFGHYFYGALAAIAVAEEPDSDDDARTQCAAIVAEGEEFLRVATESCAANYEWALELIRAERARVDGRHLAAMNHYRRAIELARANEFIGNEGLAYELAGRFYESQGLPEIAGYHLNAALQCYSRWGADAKVQQLTERHKVLLSQHAAPATVLSPSVTATIATTRSGAGSLLDLGSVLKASQAISQNIELPALLSSLMQIVVENAGAERGLLFMSGPNGLSLAAYDGVTPEARRDQAAPMSVVNFAARTGEPVVLKSAVDDGPFVHDSYVRARKTRSVLCQPILHQGTLLGVLYLENNLSAGAFTVERLEILRVLIAQAAISIVNARAYAALREAEHLRVEVEMARTVQQFLLPKDDPQVPGLELASFYRSASETGGDWYTYVHRPEAKELDLLLGDVTGHGVPAALVTAIVAGATFSQQALERSAGLAPQPERLLSVINSILHSRVASEYHMTFSYARISVEQKTLRFALAGHPPPLLYRRDPATGMSRVTSLRMIGSPLGSDAEGPFALQEVALGAGDVILCYTDGLVENAPTRFDVRKLRRALELWADRPATELRDRIIESALSGGGDSLADDVTLIVTKIV